MPPACWGVAGSLYLDVCPAAWNLCPAVSLWGVAHVFILARMSATLTATLCSRRSVTLRPASVAGGQFERVGNPTLCPAAAMTPLRLASPPLTRCKEQPAWTHNICTPPPLPSHPLTHIPFATVG